MSKNKVFGWLEYVKVCLKTKICVTGAPDTAPCPLDTAPWWTASNEKLTEGGHGGVLGEHGHVSGKNLQVSSQTAELGDGHGGVSAGHVPVWTVC